MVQKSRNRYLRALVSGILDTNLEPYEIAELLQMTEDPVFRRDLRIALLGCLSALQDIEAEHPENEISPPPKNTNENSLISRKAAEQLAEYIYKLTLDRRMRRDDIIHMFNRYIPTRPPANYSIPNVILYYVHSLPVDVIHLILKTEFSDDKELNNQLDSYLDGILRNRKR